MRIDSGGATGKRTVWPRTRGIHRRSGAYYRTYRVGQQGNPVSRRSRRYSVGIAVEAVAGFAGARIRTARKLADDPSGLPAGGGDQSKPSRDGGQRAIPQRSLLPAKRLPY